MKRILLGVLLIGIVGALAFNFSAAFFSDKETSTDNILQAGKLELLIDNTSYLNGVLNPGTSWQADHLAGHLFFNFTDIKPGDRGEDTISLRANDNDAWACADFKLTKNASSSASTNLFDGKLAQNINMVFWKDDGDNVLEANEATGSGILLQGTALQVLNSKLTLADSVKNNLGGTDGQPMKGATTYYIAKAWCFGKLTLAPLPQDGSGAGSPRTPANSTGGIICDGTGLGNETQSNIVMADLTFNAVQARHNPDFRCEGPSPTPTPTPTGSPSPSPSPSPTPLACNADVMLVLDRSGSIDPTKLTQLKTASNDFVDALTLSPTGNHAGMDSFASFGSLDQVLTDSGPAVKNAINALVAGGFTNLKAGIDIARGELDSVRDRPGSADKMIIITDGHPNRPNPPATAPAAGEASATLAKADGIEIFVVGVGSDVDAVYLKTIASDPAHYYSASDYSGLKTTLQNIKMCR